MNSGVVVLADLAAPTKGAFSTGPFGSSVAARNFRDSGVPMLRGANLSEDVGVRLTDDDLVYLESELADGFERSTVRRGDLVFTCWGTVGQIGLIDANARYERYIISNKQMKMTPDPTRVDSLFLYYFLSQPNMIELVKGQAIGSSVPGFNLGQLRALPVSVPALSLQRAIAEILGALDDKNAANSQLAETSLQLASAMFKESILGVPFSDQRFDELTVVGGGGTPRTDTREFWDGEVPWATPTDITALAGPYLESTSREISYLGLASCSSPLYPAGSILMTSRATIGAFAIAQVPTAVNQGFIVVNPRDPSTYWWIFHEMRDRVEEFVAHANGATFLELSRGKFKQFTVRLGSDSEMTAFGDRAAPLHAGARQALVENGSLAHLRDTLLPLLMSGRLRVTDAEKQVEAVV